MVLPNFDVNNVLGQGSSQQLTPDNRSSAAIDGITRVQNTVATGGFNVGDGSLSESPGITTVGIVVGVITLVSIAAIVLRKRS